MNRPPTQHVSSSNPASLDASPSSCRAVLAQITGIGLVALAAAAVVFSVASSAAEDASTSDASPLYGVTLPKGYRQWQLIAPAIEAEPLNELRAVLGNAKAVEAYDKGTLPFPDGTVLAKLAWKHVQSPEFPSASIPGAATTVQVMVKDSKKYAASGGWGFGRFVNGKPADLAQHQTCFACHQALVKNHDYVFTRLAR
ncbi:cytochrome P460 family protein [Variovorax sp. J22P271]|uniref:cytochrome P460 family protein n=1 Tax=Variovorax davisae TaxID=3053515 RepID=UPI0025774FC3|nr:cytochrome P460 family protein [Variovorax sp. J22P271]MDM0033644.1 cytochrome P460 family protein [Variovorax sp. J22P271]